MVATVSSAPAPRHAKRIESWGTALFLAMAAVGLGWALEYSNGNQHPDAFALLLATMACSVIALCLPRFGRVERIARWSVFVVLGGGLAWQVALLVLNRPAMYLRSSPAEFQNFLTGVVALGMIGASALGGPAWLRRLRPVLLVGGYLALAAWVLRHSPRPVIDVFFWHVDAIQALLHGQNPYTMTMPDIYGHSLFYGPGLLVNGRVQIGFPYPPLSLFISTLGQLFGGDYRWTNAVCIALCVPLIASAGRTRLAWAAAAVFLLTPRTFFVLEQGWTDAYAVFFLALVVWTARRWPKALPFALGLFFAIKHYLVLAAPLTLLMLPRPLRWKDVWALAWKSVLVAAVITLPLALLNPAAFYRDLVWFQSNQPFRTDALTVLSWYAQKYGPQLPTVLGFVAFAVITALSLWRAPRTPAGFAAATATAFLFFFAFSKQAFCNYYFFVTGAFCIASGAARLREDPERV